MDIAHYIAHPEALDKDTLYQLREVVARYPYYHAARLLFLQNLFLLHDPAFGEELRRSALFLPDRRVLFKLVEGDSYDLSHPRPAREPESRAKTAEERHRDIIDSYLYGDGAEGASPVRRQPSREDATTDYTAFLLALDDATPVPEMAQDTQEKTQHRSNLLNSYLEKVPGRIELKEEPEFKPELPAESADEDGLGEEFFTETLARIYIKQGRYSKAIEIIRRINLNNPKKSAYFADQIRFLEKLLANDKRRTENK